MVAVGGFIAACVSAVVAISVALYMAEVTPRIEDGMVELSDSQVLLIAQCGEVFDYMADLSNFPQWFPGVTAMVEQAPGRMETGKRFGEVVTYPVFGDVERLVYVTNYSPPNKLTFLYSDWTMLSITITATQTTDSRCLIDFRVGTKRTSFLYHVIPGLPFRLLYKTRGRHAMFAIRSMFNDMGGFGSSRMALSPDSISI